MNMVNFHARTAINFFLALSSSVILCVPYLEGSVVGGATYKIRKKLQNQSYKDQNKSSVLSHRISTDEILDDPTMDIDGEIQNNGTVSLDFVRATATFYDANNSILGSDFAYTEPTTLEPGQTAPFSITVGFGDNLPVGEISSIKLHISGR
jgi:hypothetical protein